MGVERWAWASSLLSEKSNLHEDSGCGGADTEDLADPDNEAQVLPVHFMNEWEGDFPR